MLSSKIIANPPCKYSGRYPPHKLDRVPTSKSLPIHHANMVVDIHRTNWIGFPHCYPSKSLPIHHANMVVDIHLHKLDRVPTSKSLPIHHANMVVDIHHKNWIGFPHQNHCQSTMQIWIWSSKIISTTMQIWWQAQIGFPHLNHCQSTMQIWW
jgi:hypothetical protein